MLLIFWRMAFLRTSSATACRKSSVNSETVPTRPRIDSRRENRPSCPGSMKLYSSLLSTLRIIFLNSSHSVSLLFRPWDLRGSRSIKGSKVYRMSSQPGKNVQGKSIPARHIEDQHRNCGRYLLLPSEWGPVSRDGCQYIGVRTVACGLQPARRCEKCGS